MSPTTRYEKNKQKQDARAWAFFSGSPISFRSSSSHAESPKLRKQQESGVNGFTAEDIKHLSKRAQGKPKNTHFDVMD